VKTTLRGRREAAQGAGEDNETVSVEPGDAESDTAVGETCGPADESDQPQPKQSRRLTRILIFGLLPMMAMALTIGAGVLKWRTATLRTDNSAAIESVRAATEGTIAILSYRPATVDRDLEDARKRLTGDFLNAYTSLTHDVVIPGAKQKDITAAARVPAAASVSAGNNRAVALVFVDQTTTVGADPPTDSSSCVRVTLEKLGGRWLISSFDPI
jgi:Mce-associated membrane protein